MKTNSKEKRQIMNERTKTRKKDRTNKDMKKEDRTKQRKKER